MTSNSALRVATLAHGHPAVSSGGAEVAALSLHRALGQAGMTTRHWSCLPHGAMPPDLNDDEHTVETAVLDSLHLIRRDPRRHKELVAELQLFEPHVVHFHHILGFGADVLHAVRGAVPNAAIVLTLHEFIPICHAQGQMVRTDGELCATASAISCRTCFPDVRPAQFALRRQALHALFSAVDAFIAPSAFLAGRYVDWGLSAAKVSVIENASRGEGALAAPPVPSARRGRFAFFGQITAFKGVDLLLEAVALVPEAQWAGFSLAIHGGGLDRQPAPFREKLANQLTTAGGRAEMLGPYTNDRVGSLMAEVDWVVVPSIWWENSPVVIQEAFAAGRPVIAADIGGMAEKVHHQIDGLHFRARNANDLARTLVEAADPLLWDRLRSNIIAPPSARVIAVRHMALYRKLLAAQQIAAESRRVS